MNELARETKCYECGITDDREKSKHKNKGYHHECYDILLKRQEDKQQQKRSKEEALLKKQEFLKKEREQKDKLYETVMNVHGLRNSQEIPPIYFMKIEEIRNNSTYLGKINKRYKDGIGYHVIDYTFGFCDNKIKQILSYKKFDSKLQEMVYILTVIRNSFVDAYHHAKNRQDVQGTKAEQINTRTQKMQEVSKQLEEKKSQQPMIENKNNNDEVDLTSLFD